ncbi:hypothetical protein [Paraburkholderia sp. Ac-20347]|uniref:hypothetical protein n=1 Tax=Paraburkholderia sp. Ac-20347 TaxID=2703892 RepID=UPI00197D04D2|nr:hypothetical protein [Paraburkholderia sp. Ac-20347]MBN3813902.1 hypothetical protein [Paraburkholderia sp. Ac-20347]
MINLSKNLTLCFFLASAQASLAGQAILFDNPGLALINEDGRLTGYYSAQGDKRSCSFLILQTGDETKYPDDSPYTETKILTFIPGDNSFSFENRDKAFDIGGSLYKRDETWFVRTDEGQAGCENALGSFTTFRKGKVGGGFFSEENRFFALGIRIVKRKTFLHDLRDGEFAKRRGFLTKWNDVILIKVRGQFSFVRFVEPRTNIDAYGQATTGWVRSADLVNPFPARTKSIAPAR